jgi:hypothetical protein
VPGLAAGQEHRDDDEHPGRFRNPGGFPGRAPPVAVRCKPRTVQIGRGGLVSAPVRRRGWTARRGPEPDLASRLSMHIARELAAVAPPQDAAAGVARFTSRRPSPGETRLNRSAGGCRCRVATGLYGALPTAGSPTASAGIEAALAWALLPRSTREDGSRPAELRVARRSGPWPGTPPRALWGEIHDLPEKNAPCRCPRSSACCSLSGEC